ncbi:hypothetical protein [Rubritalea tangerina]|uniref:hypothetical protein n=1 Tax=Rubritalea tangerina TaxID=430798 RepID=UPI00361BDB0E
MAKIKLLIGAGAAVLAFATSSCCNTGGTNCSASCGKGNCDVWPSVQDHAEYGNPCKVN